ncbi:VanZ family protein [Paenarthrobacter nitroguajacolicus]|uniref:VanZ family protein n=1 Tax=Paenarthrobacter nitroguajacolicus TaxID=211146 RepID=UPI003AE81B6D
MTARLHKPLAWRLGLIAYVLSLATVGYWPSPVDELIHGTLDAMLMYLHGNGIPGWFDYRFVEASANVILFVPFGVLTAMALPRKTWQQLAGIGLIASLCLEVGQLVFITARFPTAMDVVTNTAGAVIGLAFARLVTPREFQGQAEVKNPLQP